LAEEFNWFWPSARIFGAVPLTIENEELERMILSWIYHRRGCRVHFPRVRPKMCIRASRSDRARHPRGAKLLDRERRATERRIHQAKFEVVKSLDAFDFLAIPSWNKSLVLDLAAASSSSGRKISWR
jgi:hypothetical protein